MVTGGTRGGVGKRGENPEFELIHLGKLGQGCRGIFKIVDGCRDTMLHESDANALRYWDIRHIVYRLIIQSHPKSPRSGYVRKGSDQLTTQRDFAMIHHPLDSFPSNHSETKVDSH